MKRERSWLSMKFEIPLSYGHTVLILAVTQEDVSKIPFKNSNLNIACHYTRSPRNYDLTIKSTPRFALFITGRSAALRQGLGK
jgi:hypothetical protein